MTSVGRAALRLGAAAIGGGLLAAALAVLLNPLLLMTILLLLNGAISVWWGINVLIFHRPW